MKMYYFHICNRKKFHIYNWKQFLNFNNKVKIVLLENPCSSKSSEFWIKAEHEAPALRLHWTVKGEKHTAHLGWKASPAYFHIHTPLHPEVLPNTFNLAVTQASSAAGLHHSSILSRGDRKTFYDWIYLKSSY